MRQSNFNSIKVRLKLCLLHLRLIHRRFQFHKGTIKTFIFMLNIRFRDVFQFHKGTIKTKYTIVFCVGLCYFNSIKVRLKPLFVKVKAMIRLFQFHKGTIKTNSQLLLPFKVKDFNSIKVRLKLFSCIKILRL